MIKIILLGEPRSTGSIYKITTRGRFASIYMTSIGREAKSSYINQALSQWKDKPMQGDVYIDVKLYFGTKRKSDIDNFHKLSFDALTGIVWNDDSQIQKMTVEKFYDHDNPRIEIDIKNHQSLD